MHRRFDCWIALALVAAMAGACGPDGEGAPPPPPPPDTSGGDTASDEDDVVSDPDHIGFVRQYGDTGRERPTGVAAAPDGSLVVAGYGQDAYSFGGPGFVGPGREWVVARYDAEGRYLWHRVLPEFTEIHQVALSDRNVFVAGRYKRTPDLGGGPLPRARPESGIFLLTLTLDGAFVASRGWVVEAPEGYGSGMSDVRGLVADPTGHVVLTGTFFGRLDLGGGPVSEDQLNAFLNPNFVAKFRPDGALIWARSLRAAANVRAMAAASDGAVYISGQSWRGADIGDGPWNNTNNAPFVASLDASTGATRWLQVLNGVEGDVSGLAATPRGVAFVCAYSGAAFTFAGTTFPAREKNSEALILGALDTNGTPAWARVYAVDAKPALHDEVRLAADAEGRLTVSLLGEGVIHLGGAELPAATGNERPRTAFAAQYDASGAHRWSRSLPNFTATNAGYHFLAAQPKHTAVMVTWLAKRTELDGQTYDRVGVEDLLLLQLRP